MDELKNEIKNSSKFGTYQLCISYTEQLLIDLIRENTLPIQSKKSSDDAKRNVEKALISSIKEFLKENIYSNITLIDICKKFNMSKSYLCHLFKAETNIGIAKYYSNIKIEKAKEMLFLGSNTITEISDILGYTSVHNFSRAFKQSTGISPTQFKKLS